MDKYDKVGGNIRRRNRIRSMLLPTPGIEGREGRYELGRRFVTLWSQAHVDSLGTCIIKPLRFDLSGAIHAEYGVTEEQLRSLYPRLDVLRRELVEIDSKPLGVDALPSDNEVASARFYGLPKEFLDDYKHRREASELGRVFKVANTLKDVFDAVVVLGCGGAYIGPFAIMAACCDPYHNELSRAARGGKPRIYFDGNDFDNDASRALLSRLEAGGYGDTDVERRWALIVISESGETLEPAVAFRQFTAALRSSLPGTESDYFQRFLIPITGPTGTLRAIAEAVGCEEVFNIPKGVSERFGILSSIGLLPAAMLGLDCMKLLEGAAAMNEHFESTPPSGNMVLQYVAVNHLLEKHRGLSRRVLNVWSKELEAFGNWYDQLLASSLGKQGFGVTPSTVVHSRDLHGWLQQNCQGRPDKAFNNLIVEQCRTDLLSVGQGICEQDSLSDLAGQTVPALLAASIQETNRSLHAAARPTTDLILPTIDTYVLGQLFQMLMIATVIEGKLLGIDPYGQLVAERFRSDLNQSLCRK